ncbi:MULTISPECIES: polymorphic toxin type 15 domain-containing protein [Streptococcus]|jgi:hypothetical protein|uniref:Putative transposase n=1 Tax=Streptococcus viridans TaxID=78535 RepID=A0A3S4MR06_9STRE|nr:MULTISPECIES: polymorphic toxin type 15 domain-containing protein [Streptococcus]VED66507.1 putative transposase [Streptococcus viridans]VEE18637.1 putative transposase [Streptococcus australis]
MGFHVEMEELLNLKKTYLESAEKAEEQLNAAKDKMNAIITSNSMYGEVGKAINNEINNSHNAVIVGLKTAYTLMDADYTQALTAFRDGVGETSETAILDEEVMTQTKTKMTDANTKHSDYETNISQIYSSINDLISLSSPSSNVSSSITKANTVLSDAITKVNAFDSDQTELNTESLLTALQQQIDAGNAIQELSYTDPRFVEIVSYSQLAEGIKQVDDQITQAKKEQEEAARKAKEEEEEWRKNHPAQAMIKDARKGLGDWWDGVINATKNLDIPVVRETLLFAEGFIGGASSLVGDLAYLYFDVQQFTMELLFVGTEKLTGLNVAPDWVEKDVNGAWNNVVALKDAFTNTFTLENGQKVLDYSWKLMTDERTRAEAWRDTKRTTEKLWNDFTKDGWYNTGGVVFEVGSWFVGAGEVKAGLTAAKTAKTFAEGARLFTSTVGRHAVKNADDMAQGLLHLATRGPAKTKAFAKNMINVIADSKTTFTRWSDELGEGISKLKSVAGKWGDNLAARSPEFNTFRENFRNALSNFGDNMAYAGANYSDNINRSGARVYNMADDAMRNTRKATTGFSHEATEQLAKHGDEVAKYGDNVSKTLQESTEQVGKKASREVGQEATEQLAKHGDEVSKGLKETAEQAGKKVGQEFSQETSEQLVKHSDDVAKGLEETAETGKRAANNFADDIGEEIPRLDEVSVEFKYKDKFDETEFSRQLKGQQDGLNDLTVQEYFDNRERYLKEGRSKEGSKAQKAARKEALEDKIRELMLSGDTPDVAEKKAKEWMKEQAALHDPDQIAGGDPTKIRGVGDRRVNSSLGSQWKTRIDDMDEQIRKLAAGLSPEELKTTYLNINLSY